MPFRLGRSLAVGLALSIRGHDYHHRTRPITADEQLRAWCEAAGEAVEPERRARPLRPNSNRPQHRLITESPHQATYDPRVEVTRPAKRRRRGRRQVRGLERRGHLTGMMMIVDRPAEVEDHSELGSGNLNVVKLRQSAAVGFSGSSDGQSAVEQRPGQIVGSAESSGSTTRPPGTSSPPNPAVVVRDQVTRPGVGSGRGGLGLGVGVARWTSAGAGRGCGGVAGSGSRSVGAAR